MPGFPRAAFATGAAHGHAQPWPPEATAVLGEAGVLAVNGLLKWHAAARLTARELLDTGYCNPCRLELGGLLGPAERSLRAEGAGLPKMCYRLGGAVSFGASWEGVRGRL